MKYAFLILAAFLSINALADTGVYNTQFDKLSIDSKLDIGNFITGSMTIDYGKREVNVNLVRSNLCNSANSPCETFVLMPPYVISLAITKIETDKCGVIHISSEQDGRRIEKDLQTLTIALNSDSRCDLGFNFPEDTVVVYNTVNSRGLKTESTFSGPKLKKLAM